MLHHNRYYHFADYSNPTRYHIANQLNKHGFLYHEVASSSLFNDQNLNLPKTGTQRLEYKHHLADMLQAVFPDLVPLTFVVEESYWPEILQYIATQSYSEEAIWILKPALLNNGDHIKLFNSIAPLWDYFSNPNRLQGPYVLQFYIPNPKLYQGRKFSLRFYVIITNYNGVYLFPNGYANVSMNPFDCHDLAINSHLTNEHLQGSLCHVEQIPSQNFPHQELIYSQVVTTVRSTLQALTHLDPTFRSPAQIPQFDIFGFDFILDATDKLWLLEVNHGPHFPTVLPHELNESLFYPFWSAIAQDFVLPISLLKQPLQHSVSNFEQICRKQSWLDRVFHRY